MPVGYNPLDHLFRENKQTESPVQRFHTLEPLNRLRWIYFLKRPLVIFSFKSKELLKPPLSSNIWRSAFSAIANSLLRFLNINFYASVETRFPASACFEFQTCVLSSSDLILAVNVNSQHDKAQVLEKFKI